MPAYILILLITATWIAYPVVGIIGLNADIAREKRSKDAGFSYLPELIIYPPLFFGGALIVDYFVMPWGRLFGGPLCVLMMSFFVFDVCCNLPAIRRERDRD